MYQNDTFALSEVSFNTLLFWAYYLSCYFGFVMIRFVSCFVFHYKIECDSNNTVKTFPSPIVLKKIRCWWPSWLFDKLAQL